MNITFTYDPAKARSNVEKHGVSFDEAATVFADDLSMTIPDPEHSFGERRFVIVGMSSRGRLITVSHSDPGDTIRLINARRATGPERRDYEQG